MQLATEHRHNENARQVHFFRPRLGIGSRLAKNAFDASGNLLLRAGESIVTDEELTRLSRSDVAFTISRPKPLRPNQPHANPPVMERKPAVSPDLDASVLNESVRQAASLKMEATKSIRSVFDRIGENDRVDVTYVKATVTPLIENLLGDPRALLTLVQLKDADAYTFTHSVNVAILSMSLALYAGYCANLDEFGTGAMLHDIGKTRVAPQILQKAGPLSQAEAAAMEQHPKLGAAILTKSGGFGDTAFSCVLDHHENMIGTGYPQKKKAADLPVQAKITTIADIYDALTTDRPYRKALAPREALSLMTHRMSTVLEPELLSRFVSLMGFFPIGSTIELNNGYSGVVICSDPAEPTRPAIVQLLRDPRGNTIVGAPLIDLRGQDKVAVNCSAQSTPTESVMKLVAREIREFDTVA